MTKLRARPALTIVGILLGAGVCYGIGYGVLRWQRVLVDDVFAWSCTLGADDGVASGRPLQFAAVGAGDKFDNTFSGQIKKKVAPFAIQIYRPICRAEARLRTARLNAARR